jgi:hypothetical protein
LFAGAVQVNPITELLVTAALFVSKVGGSGIVSITAPLPATDAAELPWEFMASTVAKTLAGATRL